MFHWHSQLLLGYFLRECIFEVVWAKNHGTIHSNTHVNVTAHAPIKFNMLGQASAPTSSMVPMPMKHIVAIQITREGVLKTRFI